MGSYGKKVGLYYSGEGADNIDLITPKFETSLTEEQPIKGSIREGSFQETALFMENIEEKNYYKLNPYATYSGGDFRLQIFRNQMNPNGKKMVMIRDSISCAVVPFLALQVSELHVIDIRNYEYYVGDPINTFDYIRDVDPDYVIVQYLGIDAAENMSGRFDFNQ